MCKARMVKRWSDTAGDRNESPVKRMIISLMCGIGGYIVAVEASYFLIMLLSSNMHDRSLVAAMNSALVFGPGGAVAGFAVSVIWIGRHRKLATRRWSHHR